MPIDYFSFTNFNKKIVGKFILFFIFFKKRDSLSNEPLPFYCTVPQKLKPIERPNTIILDIGILKKRKRKKYIPYIATNL
jgi:hypothetical protein